MWRFVMIWGFPSHGGTPKSSILVGFSIINHPAIGVAPFEKRSGRDGRSPPAWLCRWFVQAFSRDQCASSGRRPQSSDELQQICSQDIHMYILQIIFIYIYM